MRGSELSEWAAALDVGTDDDALAVLSPLLARVEELAGLLRWLAGYLADAPSGVAADLLAADSLMGNIMDELAATLNGFARHERGSR